MATAGPTWYEILGVAPDATPAEIKAAWREATDKFEPGSGASQFRLFNEAADTLLDPDKRAAYDAELAGAPAETTRDLQPAETPAEDAALVGATAPDSAPEARPTKARGRFSPLRVVDPLASTLGLAILGVLLVAALVGGLLIVKNIQDQRSAIDNGPQGKNGGLAAQSVAETAMTAALSYDYRHLDADKDKVSGYVAPSFRKEFLATYELISQGPNGTPGGAIKLKAVQTAEVLHSAVEDGSNDKLAKILLFLNTTTSKTGTSPQLRAWRVVATMQHTGGKWLIKSLDIY